MSPNRQSQLQPLVVWSASMGGSCPKTITYRRPRAAGRRRLTPGKTRLFPAAAGDCAGL